MFVADRTPAILAKLMFQQSRYPAGLWQILGCEKLRNLVGGQAIPQPSLPLHWRMVSSRLKRQNPGVVRRLLDPGIMPYSRFEFVRHNDSRSLRPRHGGLARLLAIAAVAALGAFAEPAYAQTTLVLVRYIDRVEHLNLLEKLWKPVNPSGEKSLLSQEDWPELKTSTQLIGGATVVHFANTGFDDQAAIEAPAGYTICHAVMKEPSVTCNGSLSAVYRVAADPESDKIDGLHYKIAFSKPNPTAAQPIPGRCWVYGTIMITFVLPTERSKSKCGQTGTAAFQYPNSAEKIDTNKK
jgi:hypothetical protein